MSSSVLSLIGTGERARILEPPNYAFALRSCQHSKMQDEHTPLRFRYVDVDQIGLCSWSRAIGGSDLPAIVCFQPRAVVRGPATRLLDWREAVGHQARHDSAYVALPTAIGEKSTGP